MKPTWETLFAILVQMKRTLKIDTKHGLAAINQINSMLNLTSLGHFFFEISLVLRDSILINKLVFNSEVWYHVYKAQIEKLEQID